MGLRAANVLRRRATKKKRNDPKIRDKIQGKKYSRVLGMTGSVSGIVLNKIGLEAKQPNSAVRKGVNVQLKNGKKVKASVRSDGGLNKIERSDEVLLVGLGKNHRSTGDIPGVKFRVSKVSNVPLELLVSGKKEKPAR